MAVVTVTSMPAARRHQHIGAPTTDVRSPPQRGRVHLLRSVSRILVLMICDAAVLLVLVALIHGVRDHQWLGVAPAAALGRLVPVGVLSTGQLIAAVLLCLVLLNTYGATGRGQDIGRRVAGAGLGLALPYWAQIWTQFRLSDLSAFGLLVLAAALLLILQRHLLDRVARSIVPTRLGTPRVLLIAGRHDLRRAHEHPALANRRETVIAGVFDPEILRRRKGAPEALSGAVRDSGADTMVLCCGPITDEALSVVQDAAVAFGCELVALPRPSVIASAVPRLAWPRGAPLVVLSRPAIRLAQLLCKRAMDIVGALAVLLVTAPVLALVALAVKLEGPGPIVFGQWRVGSAGRLFRCYKFRSMRVDAEELLRGDPELYGIYVRNNFKLPEGRDPRITRLGRLLRVSSLDELPQLWNVLRGDMSLVGPRPVVPDELEEYGDRAKLLLSLRPGMAGEWAVSGRSRVGYPDRARIELGYVRGWGLGLDLSILARVMPAVFKRRGAQ